MKVQNKWIFLHMIIFSLLVAFYYYYTGSYRFNYKELEIRAAFPSQPKLLKVAGGFSNDITGASDIYQLSTPGITYIVSITEINEEARITLPEEKILRAFTKDINLLSGVKFRNVRPIFLDKYNGKVIAFSSIDKMLYGQFYLTTNAIVSIFIRQEGTSLKSGARQFIDSLTISERRYGLKEL